MNYIKTKVLFCERIFETGFRLYNFVVHIYFASNNLEHTFSITIGETRHKWIWRKGNDERA